MSLYPDIGISNPKRYDQRLPMHAIVILLIYLRPQVGGLCEAPPVL